MPVHSKNSYCNLNKLFTFSANHVLHCLVQVVIVPIWKKDGEKEAVLNAAASLKEVLHSSGIRVKLDDSDQRTPGWKFNFWEMKV